MSYHLGQMPGFSDQLAMLQRGGEAQANNQLRMGQMLAQRPQAQMPEPEEGFMAKLGTGLGQGISSGLTGIVNDYLEKQAEQRSFGRRAALRNALSANPDEREYLEVGNRMGARRADIEAEYGLDQAMRNRLAQQQLAAGQAELRQAQIEEANARTGKLNTESMKNLNYLGVGPGQQGQLQPSLATQTSGAPNDQTGQEISPSGNLATPAARAMLLNKDTSKMSEYELERHTKELEASKKAKELEEVPKQFAKKYDKHREKAETAEKSIGNIQQMRQALQNGAQMPDVVTSMANMFGKDSYVTKIAERLAQTPASQAFPTLVLSNSGDAKEMFNKMTQNEFATWLQKQPNPTDYKQSNLMKLQIIETSAQLAMARAQADKDAIKHLKGGSSQEIEDLSDQIFARNKESMYAINQEKINAILNPELSEGRVLGGTYDDNDKFVTGWIPVENIQAAEKKGWKVIPQE